MISMNIVNEVGTRMNTIVDDSIKAMIESPFYEENEEVSKQVKNSTELVAYWNEYTKQCTETLNNIETMLKELTKNK